MILIATNSQDTPVVRPVIDILQRHGQSVLVYFADHVAEGKTTASITLDTDGQTTFAYGDTAFTSQEVTAAWYRRPNIFGPEELNQVYAIYLDRQRKATQDSLWYSIPAERWLNSPGALESMYKDKLAQLRLARQVGLDIPRTVISNNWAAAYDSFDSDEVIVKLPNGRLYIEKQAHFLTSTIINQQKLTQIEKANPFPGIWQEFVPKKKEWRITVVGDQFFSAAIYTSQKARADWRRHQFDKRTVRFKMEEPPVHIKEQCIAVLEQIGVRFGAFDFIETVDGRFLFLEVNLNGSYHWLVNELELPIPEAIAKELLKISKGA